MSGTSIRELATLPMPGVIETLSFDAVFADMARDFQRRYPEFTALLESDPAIKLLEVASYRELLLRNRINEAARGQMLAFATATDLDHLGAFMVLNAWKAKATAPCSAASGNGSWAFPMPGGADTYRYWALEHFDFEIV
jgi:phage-related baseplate assembly protein